MSADSSMRSIFINKETVLELFACNILEIICIYISKWYMYIIQNINLYGKYIQL